MNEHCLSATVFCSGAVQVRGIALMADEAEDDEAFDVDPYDDIDDEELTHGLEKLAAGPLPPGAPDNATNLPQHRFDVLTC